MTATNTAAPRVPACLLSPRRADPLAAPRLGERFPSRSFPSRNSIAHVTHA